MVLTEMTSGHKEDRIRITKELEYKLQLEIAAAERRVARRLRIQQRLARVERKLQEQAQKSIQIK